MIGSAKGRAGLLAAGLVAAVFAGCGGSSGAASNSTGTTKTEAAVPVSVKSSSGNKDVSVVSSGVLKGARGTAIAVQLRNQGSVNQTWVPISLTVKDSNGKTVYSNSGAGRQSLTHVTSVPPGGLVWWVADGLKLNGSANQLSVRVGASKVKPTGKSLAVQNLRIAPGQHGGVNAIGNVANATLSSMARVTVSAVATRGTAPIAAGSVTIVSVPRKGKSNFALRLTGDPTGGDLVANATSAGAGSS